MRAKSRLTKSEATAAVRKRAAPAELVAFAFAKRAYDSAGTSNILLAHPTL